MMHGPQVWKLSVLCLGLALACADVLAQTETKLSPERLAPGDTFGRSVVLSPDGRYAVVGAPEILETDSVSTSLRAGRAFVFERTDGEWVEHSVLAASDADSLSFFGRAVAISGDASRIFVGAPYTGYGAVYVFVRDGEGWREEAKLEIIEGNGPPLETLLLHSARFGKALAVSQDGGVLAVAAEYEPIPGAARGSVNLFRRTGSAWQPVDKLSVAGGKFFGTGLAISADGRRVVAAAAACCAREATGLIYVFDEHDGKWEEQVELKASDAFADNDLGTEIALTPDGEWMLAGAPRTDKVGSSSGAAYLFQRVESKWIERQRILPSDEADQNFFGSAVALTSSADTLLIGSFGRDEGDLGTGGAYVFVRDGEEWVEKQVFTASEPDGYNAFGNTIHLTPSGRFAILGLWPADERGRFSGLAYIYEFLPATSPVPFLRSPTPIEISIYPNPTRNNATLSLSIVRPGPVEAVLVDVLGREVQHIWKGLGAQEYSTTIEIFSLPEGLYFLHVSTQGEAEVEPLIIMR